MSSDDKPWQSLRTRIITRAFYEDAYLDFFIKYYTALGFDNIVILKADTDRLPDYQPPSDDELMAATGRTSRIDIIPVVNEGNNIIKTHYSYYADKEYEWILNIDADEFLVIDLEKYPGGIKEYIYRITYRLADARTIPSADACQQIKFRWMCINKLNNQWPAQIVPEMIVNPAIKLPNITSIPEQTPNPQSMAGYFLTHPLEIYKFVKSMCNTKWANPEPRINAHFFCPIPYRGRNFNVLDGDLRGGNDSDPRHYPRNRSMLQDGYILHINTRSLANAITKCLTTQLRDNKKIKDPVRFRQIVNSFSPASIITPTSRQELKREFADQLNSKSFFPLKIRRFNSLVARYINPDYIYQPLTSLINSSTNTNHPTEPTPKTKFITNLVMTTPIVNEALEWQILTDLCLANDINPENMRQIINLF